MARHIVATQTFHYLFIAFYTLENQDVTVVTLVASKTKLGINYIQKASKQQSMTLMNPLLISLCCL